jgi:hypothetical protein
MVTRPAVRRIVHDDRNLGLLSLGCWEFRHAGFWNHDRRPDDQRSDASRLRCRARPDL